MFYVYAFYDKTRKIFYVGFTNDLKRRLKEHNIGKTQTTSRMANKLLVYYEACLSKKDAEEREGQLKTGFGRGYLKRRLKNYLEGA
ncbi:MAG: GIY-YIG nuclease family protein [Candidatus Staskawiczbacteria bacterium]|nr:GIY-YIG nuclease family protein [Candidatus Staskawiczbacteria bacterium]